MGIIQLKNINKSYNGNKILKNFSLSIEEGEMISITGKSGSGKTTILNIIGLLEDFESGVYEIDGEKNIKVSSMKATRVLRGKINYLFQNFALIEEETVSYNLQLALKYVKSDKKEKLIEDALKQVNLKGYKNRKIYELSGGEQQRVCIARCILKPCKIILADEPTGSLDKENVTLVLELLKELNKDGKTIIIVTHDDFVANQCSRIINLNEELIQI